MQGISKALLSKQYIDSLVDSPSHEALVTVAGYIWAAAPERDLPTYGLELPLFVFCEALTWFSQSIRSGVWTYYEATPTRRQEAMKASLAIVQAGPIIERYAFGMIYWRDFEAMTELDQWLGETDDQNTSWLAELLNSHRDLLKQLLC